MSSNTSFAQSFKMGFDLVKDNKKQDQYNAGLDAMYSKQSSEAKRIWDVAKTTGDKDKISQAKGNYEFLNSLDENGRRGYMNQQLDSAYNKKMQNSQRAQIFAMQQQIAQSKQQLNIEQMINGEVKFAQGNTMESLKGSSLQNTYVAEMGEITQALLRAKTPEEKTQLQAQRADLLKKIAEASESQQNREQKSKESLKQTQPISQDTDINDSGGGVSSKYGDETMQQLLVSQDTGQSPPGTTMYKRKRSENKWFQADPPNINLTDSEAKKLGYGKYSKEKNNPSRKVDNSSYDPSNVMKLIGGGLQAAGEQSLKGTGGNSFKAGVEQSVKDITSKNDKTDFGRMFNKATKEERKSIMNLLKSGKTKAEIMAMSRGK